jgi:hypothetical protein
MSPQLPAVPGFGCVRHTLFRPRIASPSRRLEFRPLGESDRRNIGTIGMNCQCLR